MARITWQSDRPLDFEASLARHLRWGPDPVNVVVDDTYLRVARGPAGPFPYAARQLTDGSVRIEAETADLARGAAEDLAYRLAEHLPREPLLALADRDPVVRRLVERFPGYRPPLVPDPFELLVSAICAQQINLTWATTLRRRLVERYGRPHEVDGVTVWEFPSSDRLSDEAVSTLRALQLSGRKAEYLIGVAKAHQNGYLEGLEGLERLTDREVVNRLVELRGVGRWTADWLLARGLGRPRAVAAGDLGVRTAVGLDYLDLGRPATEEEVRQTADGWGEAANWTAHLLLEALADR